MRFQGSLFLLLAYRFVVATASIPPIFNFPSCSICANEGESPTNGDLVLPVNTAGILIEEATCDEVEANAMEGDYSPFACTVLQQQIADDCGCAGDGTTTTGMPVTAAIPTAPVPTAAPVAANPTTSPVTEPVAVPSGMPVMVPVAVTTEMPVMILPSALPPPSVPSATTSAPTTAMPVSAPIGIMPVVVTEMPATMTMAPVTDAPVSAPVAGGTDMPAMVPAAGAVNTTVGITLDGVSALTLDEEAALLEKCDQYLAFKFPNATGLSTRIKQIRSLEGTVSIYVLLEVTGFTDELDGDKFQEETVTALNDPEFMTLLSGTAGFETVTVSAEPGGDVIDTPTAAPTGETVNTTDTVNTTVAITLGGVSELTSDDEAVLVDAAQLYLAGKLPCATGVTVSIKEIQSLTAGIYVVFEITGFTDELDNDEFQAEAITALNDPEFLTLLTGMARFEAVTTVLAEPEGDTGVTDTPTATPAGASPTDAPVVVNPTVAPTGAPIAPPTAAPAETVVAPSGAPNTNQTNAQKADDDDGLSGGAIAGIIAAVAVGVILIGVGVYCCSKGSSPAAPRAAPAATAAAATGSKYEPVSEVVQSDMMYPPAAFQATKIDKPPVASAAAIAAAASGSFMGDPSVIKTGSQIGAEAGASDASTAAGDTAASGAMSSLKQSMLCREVDAPPGKLGIVIDTTLEGPVVHKISSESPLEGIVFPGDIIVAINDVDTRAMSASAITALMSRTSASRRVLTVLSEDVSN